MNVQNNVKVYDDNKKSFDPLKLLSPQCFPHLILCQGHNINSCGFEIGCPKSSYGWSGLHIL